VPVLHRVVTAAVFVGVGLWLSQWVRGLAAYGRDNSWRLGFEMMGIEIGLAAVAIAIAWALPGRVSDRLGLQPSILPTGAVVALAIGTLGLSQAVNGLLELRGALEGSVVVGISRGLQHAQGWSLVVAFFGTAVAPAIGEELLCRGLLQRNLARRVGPFIAIVTASLFFGWLHRELVHGAIAASIGLYLGLAAHWGDSTRPAIAGHGLNNFAALLGSAGILQLRAPIVLSIGLGLGLAVGALLWARRAHRRVSAPPGADSSAADEHPELQPEAGSADT
jgi:membrane protease YdiL (CAAX protease family)